MLLQVCITEHNYDIICQRQMLFFNSHISFPKLEPWWLWWFLFKLWFTSEQYKSWISFITQVVAKWYNSTGQEIDSLTLSAGYKQMIGKSTMLQVSPCHALFYYFVLSFKLWSWYFKIFFDKTNIYVPLPPVHIQGAWNYCQAKVKNIKYLSVEERMNVLTKHY